MNERGPIVFSDHALTRARERIGCWLSRAEQFRVFLSIVDGNGAVLLKRHPDGREVYAVHIYGVPCRVAYEPVAACVLTVLTGLSRRPNGC